MFNVLKATIWMSNWNEIATVFYNRNFFYKNEKRKRKSYYIAGHGATLSEQKWQGKYWCFLQWLWWHIINTITTTTNSRTIIGNGVFYLQMLLTVFFHSTPFYSSKHSWFVTLLLLALSILPCPLHNLLTALWCMCVISWLINRTRYHYR